MKKERIIQKESNIELLKVISIFLIILHHYCIHNSYAGDLNLSNINFNLLLTRIFSFGKFANHIFIIVTGYFMINKNIKYTKIIKLVFEMYFYSILIFLIFKIFNIVPLGDKDLIKSILPIIYGNWFLVYYIIL